MNAVDDVHLPRFVIVRHEARAAKERRWYISGLNTQPVVYQEVQRINTPLVV